MEKLNWLDIVILIPIVFGLIRGLLRGFVRELTGILAIIGGVIAAKMFAPACAKMLLDAMNITDKAALFLAYVLLFVGVALVCKLLAMLITSLLKKVDLNWINRLAGAVFGSLAWAMIVSLVLNLCIVVEPYYAVIKPEAKAASLLYKPATELASVAKGQVQKYLPKEETNDLLPVSGR